MIEVSHLSKSYGSRPAVQDLSFTVPDGQIYGLLGPNGAGTVSYTHLTLPTTSRV